jgi:hypothetical protein
MKGRVRRLQELLLILASAAILGSESRGNHDLILPSHIRDFPTLEGQVRVFITLRNRVAQLYGQALGSSSSPSTIPKATVEVFETASTWGCLQLNNSTHSTYVSITIAETRLCQWEIRGKMYNTNSEKACTDQKPRCLNLYAANLDNEPSPWTPMHTINWRIL